MNCESVERWLNEARPTAGEAGACAHAAGCRACARALEAALELEVVLAAGLAPAPPGLTAGVMARVERAQRRDLASLPAPPAFDWWVRAAAEPAAALALVLAALLLWRGPALTAPTAQAVAGLAGLLASALSWALSALGAGLEPARAALSLVALMALPWASWLLFRWSEVLIRPRSLRGS